MDHFETVRRAKDGRLRGRLGHHLPVARRARHDHRRVEDRPRHHRAETGWRSNCTQGRPSCSALNEELQQFAAHRLSRPQRAAAHHYQLRRLSSPGATRTNSMPRPHEYIAFVHRAAHSACSRCSPISWPTRGQGERAGHSPWWTAMPYWHVSWRTCRSPLPRRGHDHPRSLADRLGRCRPLRPGDTEPDRQRAEVSWPAPPQIHVSAQWDGQHWRFGVRDNGIGIDPHHAPRLFQVFQRLHTRRSIPGTGIGLSDLQEDH